MRPVTVVRPRVSYADLERAPEDGRRYELYDGEVFVVPAPILKHQIVQHLITDLLYRHAKAHGGLAADSPIDIVFSEYNVLQPDVIYFSPARARLLDINKVIRHAPDLCVEVLSPSTAATDRGKKMQMFVRYRVPEYWIVDPAAETIEIYQLGADAYVLHTKGAGDAVVQSATIPDLSFSVRAIFPEQ